MTHEPRGGSPGSGGIGANEGNRAGDGRPPFQARPRRLYAALDLGTNNCRLLVARPEGASFRVVDAFSRIVRLGEGLAQTGRLSEAAMDRAVEALKVCRMKLRDRQVARARLIATEACRQAENGETFIARVKEETGLALEIVDRHTEAQLAAQGCVPLADPKARGVILFDIGGGSSELVWLLPRGPGRNGGPPTAEILGWTSLPVGVVTLAERHDGKHVTPESFARMVDEVAGMVEGFAHRAAIRSQIEHLHMLGTSGTVTTLAGVHLGLPKYDRRRVDGAWLEAGQVDTILGGLLEMSYEERIAHPCIGAERADLVLAGCAILEGMRRHFPCQRLRVADRGLREGILVGLMRQDGVWRRPFHHRPWENNRPGEGGMR
ncbi:Ppx/GppA phosphatase family protein [Phreatobacter sp.]|uniref:Ppx/GppA phosphatase family protein n=1 Tax=Phreatobacter sp. TaxID=1966341 RepID=UPI003F6E67B8